MSRRRLTWNEKSASAPPAMPGYQEPSVHPAAYPDPEADAYENGDTSSWAEDPTKGPYPNSLHPAMPGTEEPQGHPATDPTHYFPPGVAKQANRQLRAALEAKAAKCIRIATAMLGKDASVAAIEDQALDLMNLTERQIQAALRRLGSGETAGKDLISVDNETLTPPRDAGCVGEEELKADEDTTDAEEELLAAMLAEEADQNDPDTYTYTSEEDEGMLQAMLAEEAKKMASEKTEGKKSDEEEEVEEEEEESAEAGKKAAHFQRLAAYWKRIAKKAEEDKKSEEAEEDKKSEEAEEDKKSAKKAAIRLVAGLDLSEGAKAELAALLESDETPPQDVDACGEPMTDVLMDDMGMDDMGLNEPMLADEGMEGMEELSALYGGMRSAKKADEETKAEEKKSEEKKSEEKKSAAVKPQPRKPSTGVKTLGAIAKTASGNNDVDELSKLWASAPDVSEIFGR